MLDWDGFIWKSQWITSQPTLSANFLQLLGTKLTETAALSWKQHSYKYPAMRLLGSETQIPQWRKRKQENTQTQDKKKTERNIKSTFERTTHKLNIAQHDYWLRPNFGPIYAWQKWSQHQSHYIYGLTSSPLSNLYKDYSYKSMAKCSIKVSRMKQETKMVHGIMQ